MAVAFDNAATNVSVVNNNAVTATVAVGALTNPVGIVLIGWENSGVVTVSTVKLDTSNAFTRFNGVTATMDGSPCGVDMWYLVGSALTNASHTFDVTMSGNTAAKFICAAPFQGVNQATPLAAFTSSASTTSPVTITPAGGTASDMLIAAMMNVDAVGTQTTAVGANTTIIDVVRKETTFDGAVWIGGRAAGNAATIGFSWTTVTAEETIGALIQAAGAAASSTGFQRWWYR